MAANLDPLAGEKRLDSWKEIAAFFGRDESTVKRWEKERGLPVHRVPGGTRGAIFAYSGELTRWLQGADRGRADKEDLAAPPEPDLSVDSSGASNPSGSLPRDSRGASRGTILGRLAWIAPIVIAAGFVFAVSFGHREIRFKNVRAATHQPDSQAQDLYLQGRYYFEKRTADDLNKAVDYFTQAIVHDPRYSQAYVGLADCYNLLREFGAMSTQEAEQRAYAAAKRAVELDPNSAEAHNSLAFASFWGQLDPATAEQEFQRALALDPNLTRAHHWHATFLVEIGRYQEALDEIERARVLDPSSKAILADRAFILAGAGRVEEARTLLKQMEASDPSFVSAHLYLANDVYVAEGNYEGALQEGQIAASLSHNVELEKELTAERSAYESGGAHAMFEYELTSATRDYEEGSGSPFAVAIAYANLHERDEALKYLQLAHQQHDPRMASLTFHQAFRYLHSDPEFRNIATEAGFPPVR